MFEWMTSASVPGGQEREGCEAKQRESCSRWNHWEETTLKKIFFPLLFIFYWSVDDVQYYMLQVYNIEIHNF